MDRREYPLSYRATLRLVALLGCGAILFGAAAPAHAAGPITEPTAKVTHSKKLPPSGDYGRLVRATDAHHIKSVELDQRAQELTVVYSNGDHRLVKYPSGDTSIALRLARGGATVTLGTLGGGHSTLLPLYLIGGFVACMLLFAFVANRRAKLKTAAAPAQRGMPNTAMRETEVETVPDIHFSDVAGCDEAVEELAEIAEFLSHPERFERLGAKAPAGVILHGPPGTGKTLLAKALAGEAGATFFSASASEFVETYVGVGAKRVRELFAKARKAAPAIVFIDEIDAVGGSRSGGDGGNGEREQTLNQLLVELDGFGSSDQGICVIAATNRKDMLDPALLRPGRLDRHVAVPLPAKAGRLAILGVHSSGKPLADDVDLEGIAEFTHGFSGAQLGKIVNEAAILAAREDGTEIAERHFQEAVRRVIAGPKRKSAPIAEGEIDVIAYHESGHVLCAELAGHDKARHVTIEPRDNAMGFVLYGSEDKALHSEASVHAAMVAALGGRAAEQIVFGKISSGASNDLEKTHDLARRAIEQFGFSALVGQTLGDLRLLSDGKRDAVETEIKRLTDAAYDEALAMLAKERATLDRIAKKLLAQLELSRPEIEELLAA